MDLIERQAAIERIDEALGRVIKGPCGEKILARVPSAQPEQQWIPCSERLPEVGSEVLVCYEFKGNRSVYIADFYGDGNFHGLDDEYLTTEGRKYRKAVAWMPLPQPYKGASGGGDNDQGTMR